MRDFDPHKILEIEEVNLVEYDLPSFIVLPAVNHEQV